LPLYAWLLLNFAKRGQVILDTHLGSGSSVIACLEAGFSVTAYEIDPDYFWPACERIERAMQQLSLFLGQSLPEEKPEQMALALGC
jgi:site-specific DNA-methyltransferase (adenine-specific)